jgi:hypothetical protein
MRRRKNVGDMTISEQLEKVAEEICDSYCKYPEKVRQECGDTDEAFEHLTKTICSRCPLSRL